MSFFSARFISMLTAATLTIGSLAALPGVARAVDYGPGTLVKDVPVNGTPHVLDGRVNSIVKVGNTVILGGEFTQTRNNSSDEVISRSNLVAFDATTKQISTTFAPNPNGPVNVVLPTGDGQTVYVGGSFSSIGGEARKNLVKVRVDTGAVVTEFNTGTVAGQVKDLRLAGGRLWVAGGFTHIANSQQLGLATVNPTTGKLDQFMRKVIAGLHDGGFTTVMKIDINPQGTRLVGIGNFDTVDGIKNHQIFMLDLTGAAAAVDPFHTNFYETACSRSFDSYMRDLDFAPDGKFFVVSTTGAYGGAGKSCDSTARFEVTSDPAAQPSWINNTGGDTTYAVEITDSVVYTGGHARWQNNPFAADRAGQGAVPRPGIAALDPLNGLPLSWNPTRDRGVGVFDFLASDEGLYVGSDTTRIGADYLRSRVALLPTGGTTFPGIHTPTLPSDLLTIRSSGIQSFSYDGAAFGTATPVPAGPLTPDNARGAFMLNGNLYTAWSNNTFDRRSFDGTSYGDPVAVDTASETTPLTDWATDISRMTGLFYDSGRLYFTRNDSTSLFYRFFTPENDVIGAQRLTASTGVAGLSFSQVRGMFLAGDKLYWADTTGNLKRIDWVNGAQSGRPVAGATVSTVSGAAVDGKTWSSMRSAFLFQGRDSDQLPATPVAAFGSSCTSLECTFDGSDSSVPRADISDYAWDFGDGSQGSGKKADHTFTTSGTYQVKLTVTSSKGKKASVTHAVDVARINKTPVADFTFNCNQLTCDLDGSASSDPDGTVASYAWSIDGEDLGTGAQVEHTFSTAGTRNVTLTVTDNEGATHSKTRELTTVAATLSYVGAASSNGSRTNHAVVVPASVREGDTLVLSMTVNSSTTTITAPTGWTELESGSVDGLQARVWTKTAGPIDGGTTLTVPTSSTVKSDVTISAYRVSDGSPAVVSASDLALRSSSISSMTTPVIEVTHPGSWAVSYWSSKSSSTVTFSTPSGQQTRASSLGTGSGNVAATSTDGNGPVTLGQVGGLEATLSASASRAAAATVVISPQS